MILQPTDRRSKFRHAHRGTKHSFSAVTGAATSAQTYITTGVSQVAVIDKIVLRCALPDAAASPASIKVILTLNGSTMDFAWRTFDGSTAGFTSGRTYVLRPKGSLVVNPSSSLTLTSDTASLVFARVDYRMVGLEEAINAGYLAGTTFNITHGNLVSGTRTALISAATVTSSRCLEINGFAITGNMATSTGASPGSVLLEFSDGSTHRKIVRNCYSSADPEHNNPMIVSDCVIRGPAGYGLYVTANKTVSGTDIVRASIWGRYIPSDRQSTFPGTGVAPGATDACDTGDYFWLYNENTAQANYEVFPSTTMARSENVCTIDGYAISAGLNTGAQCLFSVASAASSKVYSAVMAGVGVASQTWVEDDLEMQVRVDDRPCLSIFNAAGTATNLGMLVWGRMGGPSLSAGQDAKNYTTAS